MELSTVALIVNSIFLLIAVVIVAIMLRSGAKYSFHYGDVPIQDRLRWRILKLLLTLIVLGFVAAAFNLVAPLLMK